MKRVIAGAWLIGLLSSGCSVLLQSAPPTQAWIEVLGTQWAEQPMSVEVGDLAWQITEEGGRGVVMPHLKGTVPVRLVGIDDCRMYASFQAGPSSANLIRLAADGSVTIEDMSGEVQVHGPALIEGEPTGC